MNLFEINPTDDLIQSEAVQDRIDELMHAKDNDYITDVERDELKALCELTLLGRDYREWDYNMTIIHETHFTEAMKDLVQDCNKDAFDVMPDLLKANIDWEGVADDMRSDYSTIEWRGETFYTNAQ